MTTRTNITKVFCMLLATIMLVAGTATTALAASNSPYGFTYYDSNGTTGMNYQYYKFSSSLDTYQIYDYSNLVGNTLYDKTGNVIANDVKSSYSVTTPTAGFYSGGSFYFLNSSGYLNKMSSTTATTYSRSSTLVRSLVVDSNSGLLTYVYTQSGSKVSISSLSFSGSYTRDTSYSSGSGNYGSSTSLNRVETYSYNGDSSKIGYDAYQNGSRILTIYCKDANVWLEYYAKLLSDTCKGAKFVGYLTNYTIFLYNYDGSSTNTFYYYNYGSYTTPNVITWSGEVYYYTYDSNGFIENMVTSKGTYNVMSFINGNYSSTTASSYVSKVTKSTTYAKSYNSSSILMGTLKKSGNWLYWNDVQMSNSYSSSYFGITEENIPVWINSSNQLYCYQNGTLQFIDSNVTKLRYDDYNRAYQYYKSGSYYDLF